MEFGGGWCDVMAVFITREGTTGPGEALDTKHKTLDLRYQLSSQMNKLNMDKPKTT